MSSLGFESILSMVITGFVWGISTPLIKRYSKDIDEVYHQNKVIEVFLQLKQLVTNWKYLFAFLVNQSGSILYAISLSYNPIIIAVPVTNAINFVSVVIFGPLLGEKALDSRSLFGAILVILGTVLCILSQQNV